MAKTFRIEYQALGSTTGLTVTATCYDETHTEVTAQSGTMVESVIETGKYFKDFDIGNSDWTIHMSDSEGGKAIKHFSKPEWDTHGIEDKVGGVDTKVIAVSGSVDAVKAKTDNLPVDPASASGITTAESNIRGGSKTLEALSNQVAEIKQPPMIG